MIANLKSYPAYKDSGVLWLGRVPAHWEVFPLKRVVMPESSGSYGVDPEYGEVVLPVATTAQIDRDGTFGVGRMPRRGFSMSEKDRYGCMVGDVLVVKSSGSAANVISGKAGIVRRGDAHFVFSNFLLRLRARAHRILPEFLFHLVTMNLTRERVKMMVSATTYPNLRIDEYLSAALPVPPLREQCGIDRFLDHLDRRIRRYIRTKQKLIKLLEEQKQAIIHRAVTAGLDSNVRLKPSGVEWLGDVPAHWDVRPAKYYFSEVDERSVTGAEELLSVSHITGVTPRSQKNITMFMASSYVGHKLCRPGDLVINTMWAWMSALGIARQTGIVSPSYAVYRPLPASRLLANYADLLLRTRSYVSEYVCRSTGIRSSRLRLYPEQFLNIRVVCPPCEEQKAILHRVATETAGAEQAIAGARREIDLLREYRTRLIADVVTGKVDVRELAAGLPEVEETETQDDVPAEVEAATDEDPELAEEEAGADD